MGSRLILNVFAETCTPASDLGRARESALASGWEEFTPPYQSPIAALIRIGRSATADTNTTFVTFRREVEGKELSLVLVRAEVAGVSVNGCRLYGTVADSAPTEADIVARLQREPSFLSEELGAATVTWEPGWSAGDHSLELVTAPADSDMANVTSFSGWALVAQAVGFPPKPRF